MRDEKTMYDLILSIAQADKRIRAVILNGSRANPGAPEDRYRDYDIVYLVDDIAPFYNNPAWAESVFGKTLITQMPETMRGAAGDGSFNYLMLFPDGNRIDLSFNLLPYIYDGEPTVVLLDKDTSLNIPKPDERFWHVKPPTELFYRSCCNNFWWCLNNVAKGIARDELPYAMCMFHSWVRRELHDMLDWYIGAVFDFSVSTGKDGKYYKRYLPPEL